MGIPWSKFAAFVTLALSMAAGTPALGDAQHKQRCDNAVKKAKSACDGATNGAKGADQANNTGGQAQDAAHGGNSDRGSNNLCPRLQNQKQNWDKAKGTCESAKSQCNSDCNKENSLWSAHNEQKEGPKGGKPDPSQCGAATDPNISQLASGAAPLASQAQQACNSGDQSKGDGKPPQIPPMPQMPQKEDKKEEAKNDATKCESAEGHRYSDCNPYYTGACMASMAANGCNEFSGRYCGAARAGSQATDVTIAGIPRGGAVVVDKGGEGLGSPFCSMYQAYKFCQASSREDCPSCKGTLPYSSPECQNNPAKCVPSLSNEALKTAQNKCPTDPMFLNPEVKKQLAGGEDPKKAAETTTGGGAKTPPTVSSGGSLGSSSSSSTGGGALGGGTGSGAKEYGSAADGATPESLPKGTAVATETGGGGGSGGNYELDPEEFKSEDGKPGGRGLSAQSAGGDGGAVELPRDISNQYGPNVFSISTGVYRSMCNRGSFARCKPK